MRRWARSLTNTAHCKDAVRRTPQPGTLKDTIPFVVIVVDLVRPLPQAHGGAVNTPQRLAQQRKRCWLAHNPVFKMESVPLVLRLLKVDSVAVVKLCGSVTSLAEHGQAIVDALDKLLK